MVRMLFAGRDGDALEILVEDTLAYVVPWAARDDGVAGFVQDVESFAVWPVEWSLDDVVTLLEEHTPREVPLMRTPAWVLDDGGEGPPVSWHARCRWAERVEPMADPGPCIREAWRNGVQIGVPRGYGRYDPVSNVVVCYVGSVDEPMNVTTVYPVDGPEVVDRLRVEHLRQCEVCSGVWNPYETEGCRWCGVGPAKRVHRRLPGT